MNILIVIIIILALGFILERILDHLNASYWSNELPEELKGIYNEAEYMKAQDYSKAQRRPDIISDSIQFVLMLVLLLTGAFGKLDDYLFAMADNELLTTILFFGIVGFASDVISTPFSIYKTFVIEEKFGFNKMTAQTYISDKLKGYLLAVFIGGSLLALFAFIYEVADNKFWIYAWIILSGLMILMTMFYTSLILPLFNKLTPLKEGELRNDILEYCRKTGFGLSDVFVMDGSKRSAKANAFFSGLGSKRKIVLFDTLIEKHQKDELISVLAHETGHYKLKHTLKGMILSILQTGLMLFLFSLFMENPSVSLAMGGDRHSIELGIMAFGILYSPISLIIGILMNMVSRKHEFEADEYAAKTSSGFALKEALKKLSVNNLSNLKPHPAFVFIYYSHPPLLQRLKALDNAIRNV